MFPPSVLEADAIPPVLGHGLTEILATHQLAPNPKKIRVSRSTERQEVTGLIVNVKANVPRSFVRQIRAIIHDCETRGVAEADRRFRERFDVKQRLGPSPPISAHLRGTLDYLRMIRGNDDPLYATYAMASRVATKTHYRIQISGRAARHHHLLEDAVWVLIGKDEKGFEIQGTAFSLGGVGIVTSRHLLDNRVSSWWLMRAIPPLHRFEVTSWRFDRDLDLTILDTKAPFFGVLHPSTADARAGDPVRVAGYPAWSTGADRIWVATSRVAQLKTVGGISYIVTDAFIRGGTSGGPILSEDGCALGVIVYNTENPSTPAAGIHIKHLGDLRDASVRRSLS